MAPLRTPERGAYSFLTQIQDPETRQACKSICDRLIYLEGLMSRLGTVTEPLEVSLDAAGQRLRAIADPAADTDAVNLRSMQQYVEAAIQAAIDALPEDTTTPPSQPGAPTGPPGSPTGPVTPTPFSPPRFTPSALTPPGMQAAAIVRNVQASFCSMLDATGTPIFDPPIFGLPASERADWYARKHAAGVTHIAVSLWLYGIPYSSVGYTYPKPGYDFRSNPQGYFDILAEIVAEGFVPIVFLTDGNYPSSLMDVAQMIVLARAGTYDFAPACLWAEGWEPGWTSIQFASMFNMMRIMLGTTALLALHPIAGYIHNGAGPTDWSSSGGCFKEVDVLLAQFKNTVPPYDPTAEWFTSAIELSDRILPSGTPMPAANGVTVDGVPHGDTPRGPYYFGDHGRAISVCAFETLAFQYIRQIDGVDDAWVATMHTFFQNLGYTSFGHLPG